MLMDALIKVFVGSVFLEVLFLNKRTQIFREYLRLLGKTSSPHLGLISGMS